MLETIGIDSLDTLFEEIPPDLCCPPLHDPAPLGEAATVHPHPAAGGAKRGQESGHRSDTPIFWSSFPRRRESSNLQAWPPFAEMTTSPIKGGGEGTVISGGSVPGLIGIEVFYDDSLP